MKFPTKPWFRGWGCLIVGGRDFLNTHGNHRNNLPIWFLIISPYLVHISFGLFTIWLFNIANWKIPKINGGLVRWENHLFLWAMA